MSKNQQFNSFQNLHSNHKVTKRRLICLNTQEKITHGGQIET